MTSTAEGASAPKVRYDIDFFTGQLYPIWEQVRQSGCPVA